MWLLAETEECDLWIQIVQTNRFCKKNYYFYPVVTFLLALQHKPKFFTSFAAQAQVFLKNIFSEKKHLREIIKHIYREKY